MSYKKQHCHVDASTGEQTNVNIIVTRRENNGYTIEVYSDKGNYYYNDFNCEYHEFDEIINKLENEIHLVFEYVWVPEDVWVPEFESNDYLHLFGGGMSDLLPLKEVYKSNKNIQYVNDEILELETKLEELKQIRTETLKLYPSDKFSDKLT